MTPAKTKKAITQVQNSISLNGSSQKAALYSVLDTLGYTTGGFVPFKPTEPTSNTHQYKTIYFLYQTTLFALTYDLNYVASAGDATAKNINIYVSTCSSTLSSIVTLSTTKIFSNSFIIPQNNVSNLTFRYADYINFPYIGSKASEIRVISISTATYTSNGYEYCLFDFKNRCLYRGYGATSSVNMVFATDNYCGMTGVSGNTSSGYKMSMSGVRRSNSNTTITLSSIVSVDSNYMFMQNPIGGYQDTLWFIEVTNSSNNFTLQFSKVVLSGTTPTASPTRNVVSYVFSNVSSSSTPVITPLFYTSSYAYIMVDCHVTPLIFDFVNQRLLNAVNVESSSRIDAFRNVSYSDHASYLGHYNNIAYLLIGNIAFTLPNSITATTSITLRTNFILREYALNTYSTTFMHFPDKMQYNGTYGTNVVQSAGANFLTNVTTGEHYYPYATNIQGSYEPVIEESYLDDVHQVGGTYANTTPPTSWVNICVLPNATTSSSIVKLQGYNQVNSSGTPTGIYKGIGRSPRYRVVATV